MTELDYKVGFRQGVIHSERSLKEMSDQVRKIHAELEDAKSDYQVELAARQMFESAVMRVRELHKPYEPPVNSGKVICQHCPMFFYPCPTIKALDGEQ